MWKRRRQQTLPFRGLIVSTISITSYTTNCWQNKRKAYHKRREMHAPLSLWNQVICICFYSNAKIVIYTKTFTYDDHLMDNAAIYPHTRTFFALTLVAPQSLYLCKPISHFQGLVLFSKSLLVS